MESKTITDDGVTGATKLVDRYGKAQPGIPFEQMDSTPK